MKAQNRIHQLLSRKHVLINDLVARFLIDSNLHSITCIISDTDPAYAQNDEVTITKKQGGFVITHEIGRWEPFYGTETEVMPQVFTHDITHVKAIISELSDYDSADIELTNQHGKNSKLQIVRFASK